MDKDFYDQLIKQEIQQAMQAMFKDAEQAERHDVQYYMERIAQYAFQRGQNYTLENLLTIEDIAERYQISKRRARDIAQRRFDRFGIGRKLPGKGRWLFQPDDFDTLAPIEKHRKKE